MGNPSILIVDDEANIRAALARWFDMRGFDVVTAADGLEAIDVCTNRRFDVITMDLEMPRMGGIEAIQIIRQSDSDVPILIVTGLPRDAGRALSGGATKILMKPLRLRELEVEVRRLVYPDKILPD